jgi:hypothetical protein
LSVRRGAYRDHYFQEKFCFLEAFGLGFDTAQPGGYGGECGVGMRMVIQPAAYSTNELLLKQTVSD